MHPQIESLCTQIRAIDSRVNALSRTIDERSFHERSARGGWSVGECLAHLSLTTSAFLPGIDEALAKGDPGFSDTRIYRRGVVAALLQWSLEPPYRLRVRTQTAFVPGTASTMEAVLSEFGAMQRQLVGRIEASSGLDLTKLRVVSAFNERLSYNLYAAYCILIAHERRHVWQAENVADTVSPGWRKRDFGAP